MSKAYEKIKEIRMEPLKKQAFGPWALFLLISILPFLSMSAYLITGALAEKQEEDIDTRFMETMEVTAVSKATGIDRWLDDIVLLTNRITHSRIVQMFTMDVNESNQDDDFEGSMEQRKLYIEEVLNTFERQHNIVDTFLISRRAKIFAGLESEEQILPQGYKNIARDIFMSRQTYFSPLRMDGSKMLLDVYIPIFSLKDFYKNSKGTLTTDFDWQETSQVAGVLLITISVKEKLSDFMSVHNQTLQGKNIFLFQEISDGVEMVRLDSEFEGIFSQDKDALAKDIYKRAWNIYYLEEEGKHDLSIIPRFGSKSATMPRPGEILMVKQKIEKMPLKIMVYLDLLEAYQDLSVQRKQLHFIGQLIALLLYVIILAIWWMMQDIKHCSMAEQYQEFSLKINAQRHFLMSINKAIEEQICLKYLDGEYIYVNESFCKFFCMKEDEILGKTDADLFATHIADAFKEMDKKLFRSKKHIFEQKTVVYRDKKYHLGVSKTPFLDGNGKFVGITTVLRDITEMMQARQMKERALRNSMNAMMRIMQRHDDHLERHARYLKSVVSDFAKRLDLSEEDVMTLSISANLSQIGKIYVSQDILTAERELNDHDLLTYRMHIEDTAFILDTVDWGLPVVNTVYAMHEKLDGSGYPNGLLAKDISKLSRILAVCDRFCKLVAPRRGHKIYTPEEAIKWMVNQKGKYDLSLLQALAEMINEDEAVVLAS